MKKQAVCEYCGMVFGETDVAGVWRDYKQECVSHEITHLELDKKFENRLKTALNLLDSKFESVSSIVDISVFSLWDSYYGKEVTYAFKVSNNKMSKIIELKIEVDYNEKEHIPSVDEIYKTLENRCFTPTLNNKYEGRFIFEEYMGGHGADDYMIGEVYMNTIFRAFQGKNVRIEVID